MISGGGYQYAQCPIGQSMFRVEGSPGHLKRPGQHLKGLRDKGDARSCDIELRLRGGVDRLHSVLAASHSFKLAKVVKSAQLPLCVDMTRFAPQSVTSVVDWMYYGESEMTEEDLLDHLAVTNYLGVVFLHRQLEQALRRMAQSSQSSVRITALNIGTHQHSGVTSETIQSLVLLVHDQHDELLSEDIAILSPSAVKAIVGAHTQKSVKVDLINVALNWLRSSSHIEDADWIVSHIHLHDMASANLHAFQMTLLAHLRNPSMRRNVTVYLSNGEISIDNTKKGLRDMRTGVSSSLSSNGGDIDLRSHNGFDNSQRFASPNRRVLTPSELDVNSASEDDNYSLRSPHITLSMSNDLARIPDVFKSPKKTRRSRSRNQTEIEDIRNIPDPFKKQKEPEKPAAEDPNRMYTQSEIYDIQTLPNIFRTKSREIRSRTATEVQDIKRLPCPFERKEDPNQREQRPVRTQSEVQDINALPSLFGNKRVPNQREQRPVRPQSEVQDINALPSLVGDKRDPNQREQRAVRTQSEVQDIKALPSLFEDKGTSNQREQRPVRTQSEVQDINALPSLFEDKNARRAVRTRSEIEDIKGLDISFPSKGDSNNVPRPMRTQSEIEEFKLIPVTFHTKSGTTVLGAARTQSEIDDMKRIPNIFSPNPQEGGSLRAMRTRSEVEELKQLPITFSSSSLKSETSSKSKKTKRTGRKKKARPASRTQSELEEIKEIHVSFKEKAGAAMDPGARTIDGAVYKGKKSGPVVSELSVQSNDGAPMHPSVLPPFASLSESRDAGSVRIGENITAQEREELNRIPCPFKNCDKNKRATEKKVDSDELNVSAGIPTGRSSSLSAEQDGEPLLPPARHSPSEILEMKSIPDPFCLVGAPKPDCSGCMVCSFMSKIQSVVTKRLSGEKTSPEKDKKNKKDKKDKVDTRNPRDRFADYQKALKEQQQAAAPKRPDAAKSSAKPMTETKKLPTDVVDKKNLPKSTDKSIPKPIFVYRSSKSKKSKKEAPSNSNTMSSTSSCSTDSKVTNPADVHEEAASKTTGKYEHSDKEKRKSKKSTSTKTTPEKPSSKDGFEEGTISNNNSQYLDVNLKKGMSSSKYAYNK